MIKSSRRVGQNHSIEIVHNPDDQFSLQIPVEDVKFGHFKVTRCGFSSCNDLSIDNVLERLEKYQSDIFDANFTDVIPSQQIAHYLRNVTRITFRYFEFRTDISLGGKNCNLFNLIYQVIYILID